MVDPDKMVKQLLIHEGVRVRPYLDTEGNWTIGVGYNVTARGWGPLESIVGRKVSWGRPFAEIRLVRDEAIQILKADIISTEFAVRKVFPSYDALDEVRQRVCLDMAFNMGYHALGFKRTIAAITAHDWSTAAMELHKSKWATQVGASRCQRLAQMLLTGNDYTL